MKNCPECNETKNGTRGGLVVKASETWKEYFAQCLSCHFMGPCSDSLPGAVW